MRIANSQTDPASGGSRHSRPPIRPHYAWMLIVGLLLAVCSARAESTDDKYLRIYRVIEQAEALEAKGETRQALTKYHEALAALKIFQRDNRHWNTALVSYRHRYLVEKVTELSAPPAAPAKTSSKSAAPASASDRQAKLLEAGAEPRKELRLHPQPGAKQTSIMSINLTVEMTMGEMPSQTMKVPPITITSETTVQGVSDQGDIAFDLVITKAELGAESGALPQLVEPIKAALASVQGLAGTGTASSRGLGKGMEFKLPANATPQTRQLIEQIKEASDTLVVPLPAEPVGPGAKWEARIPLKSQGATIDQTATYQLASVEDERLVVKSTITQRAGKQTIESAALPGIKLNLTKMTGKGTGSASLVLTQLLPAERTLGLQTEQSVTMDAGGQAQPLTVKTDLRLRAEAK